MSEKTAVTWLAGLELIYQMMMAGLSYREAVEKFQLCYVLLENIVKEINDIGLLPQFLTHSDESVRNAARKRFHQLYNSWGI